MQEPSWAHAIRQSAFIRTVSGMNAVEITKAFGEPIILGAGRPIDPQVRAEMFEMSLPDKLEIGMWYDLEDADR